MSEIRENCLYFVKDSFFDVVQDDNLKKNKENTLRPHYLPFADDKTKLLWLIPCSSRIEKYEKIINDKKAKNKPHNHILIVKIGGRKEALLLQDMFPIAPEFIDKPYKNKYGVLRLYNENTINMIADNARKIIKLLRHGIKFTPTQPDINRIEKIMLEFI